MQDNVHETDIRVCACLAASVLALPCTAQEPVAGAQDVGGIRATTARNHERYRAPAVQVQDGIAAFWAPYVLDVDGRRSLCGIDTLHLVQADARWRVASLMYTVEPDG